MSNLQRCAGPSVSARVMREGGCVRTCEAARAGAAARAFAILLAAVLTCAMSACNKMQTVQARAQDGILSGPLKFIASWGTRGTAPGQFQSPEWLAIDGTGNVFVADADAKAIEKFTFDGHPLMAFDDAPLAQPFRVAVDSGGGIYALSRGVNAFYIFSPEGEAFRHYPIVEQRAGQRPGAIAVNAAGDIFIIVESGKSGSVDGGTSANHGAGSAGTGGAGTAGAGTGGEVKKDRSGEQGKNKEKNSYSDSITSPSAAAAMLEASAHREIRQYDSKGHMMRTLTTGANPSDKTFSPGSMAAGPDGNLYVLDVTATRIEKFSGDGKIIAAWGGEPPTEGLPGDPISRGVGIAVTSKYVFTPEPLNRGVRAWTVTGDARIVDDLGGRLQPTGGRYELAVSPKDELVVMDMAAAKVYRFHIDF